MVTLLNGSHFSERWGQDSDKWACSNVPEAAQCWSSPAEQLCQLTREQEDVEDWLWDVWIQITEWSCPFFNVLSQSLVWVGDSRIQIADLIEDLLLQVALMEVVCEVRSEIQGEDLVEILEVAVYKRRWDSADGKRDNLGRKCFSFFQEEERVTLWTKSA